MTDFDDVTFQKQFHFTKAEFLVILFNMQDKNGTHHTGDGNVFVNLKDHQVFQRKDRKHGYSYQHVVCPNGVCVLLPLYYFVSPQNLTLPGNLLPIFETQDDIDIRSGVVMTLGQERAGVPRSIIPSVVGLEISPTEM